MPNAVPMVKVPPGTQTIDALSLRFVDGVPTSKSITKSVLLVAEPPGVVKLIFPVVAFAGIMAVIDVMPLIANSVVTPLNFTSVVPVKFLPDMVTTVPVAPVVGVNDVIVGGR